MKVLRDIAELGSLAGNGPIHLAIGVFDGLHRGHLAVVSAAQEAARESGGVAVVVTFDPHPIRVLAPDRAPRLLTSTRHQLLLLERAGLEATLVVTFDETFATQEWDVFVRLLVAGADGRLKQICVGEDWQFGAGRRGNVERLSELGAEIGIEVPAIPTVACADDSKISSTRIRAAIEGGDFAEAARLLGRDYTVLGTVIEGRQLGRTIGFPTANLTVHNEQLPPIGVYAVRATCISNGLSFRGVGNLGYRPTIEGADAKLMLEVHLFDFDGDLYGSDLEITFLKFLRGEQKFDGVDALKKQIAVDAEQARSFLEEGKTGQGADFR